MLSKSAALVLNYVMHVLKSVKNISKWNTANYAYKHVESAPKNVVKWQCKVKKTS
jgi:hypothetical protein